MRPTPLFLLSVAFAIGCGPSVSDEPDADADVGHDASEPDAASRPDASTVDSQPVDFSLVYGHSGQVLYRLDTNDFTAIEIGPFTNLGAQSMTDIAIDKDDRMLGISLNKIFVIDEDTGAATLVTDALETPNLTSLSFVPLDIGDPDSEEILVAAADDGTVYQINTDTGETSQIGAYGEVAAGLVLSSGDIVAVRGLGIFATVTIGADVTAPDYLARIDPTTWIATPLAVATDYDRIFGIGFWRGHIYGFVDHGNDQGGAIVELDPDTGASTLVVEGDIRWFGAGVTTDAPIIP